MPQSGWSDNRERQYEHINSRMNKSQLEARLSR
jgi:hypothetical protein